MAFSKQMNNLESINSKDANICFKLRFTAPQTDLPLSFPPGKHPTLRMLVLTVYTSFYRSWSIILAQALFITVYSIVGVHLFANVKFGESLSRYSLVSQTYWFRLLPANWLVSDSCRHANFKTPLIGLLTLFR